MRLADNDTTTGAPTRLDQDTQMDHHDLQRHYRSELARGSAVGGARREGQAVPVLNAA
jgi:hypothetical protein